MTAPETRSAGGGPLRCECGGGRIVVEDVWTCLFCGSTVPVRQDTMLWTEAHRTFFDWPPKSAEADGDLAA